MGAVAMSTLSHSLTAQFNSVVQDKQTGCTQRV
uniref:Uncharacterized protein n=1 Tax=Anguilla anguilla TaxID=7936 RepID=A0A0E9VBC7_ANGAN